jgi:hypothetical protein
MRDLQIEHKAAADRVARLEAARARAVKEKASIRTIDAELADARQELRTLDVASHSGTAVRGNSPIEMQGVDLGAFDAAYTRAKQNPSLLLYKLETNAYKFSWALIPISVPFVWLLFFWKRRYKAYDHTVFVTYSLAFMTLLVVSLSLWRATGLWSGLIPLAMTFVPPVHIYRQLRGAYRLRPFGAIWRTFFLLFFALISAILFFALLLTLGVLG